MALQHAFGPPISRGQRRVHHSPYFRAQRLEISYKTFALWFAVHHETPVSRTSAIMRKAEKGKRFGTLSITLVPSHSRESAKLDPPRFRLVQHQAKYSKARCEFCSHQPRITSLLESYHEIVGVTHNNCAPRCRTTSPLVKPEIEHVMQEDVRK